MNLPRQIFLIVIPLPLSKWVHLEERRLGEVVLILEPLKTIMQRTGLHHMQPLGLESRNAPAPTRGALRYSVPSGSDGR